MLMALFHRKPKARVQADPGLQQIDAWLTAFTAFNDERLATWPDGESLDAERAKVKTLAANIAERMRADYLARIPKP